MLDLFLYIGPGLGIGTIVIIIVVLLIVLASLGMILWTPIKKFFKKLKGKGSNS